MDYSKLSDQALTALLKEGDHAAFSQLYERYKGLLYLHIKRMLANQEETKDVIQEVFTVLWSKREELHFSSSIKAYLYTSVRNRVLNILAHRKFETSYLNTLEAVFSLGDLSLDEDFRAKELVGLIEKEIENLPAKMREVFELSRKDNLSHKEIAEKLNISDKTVKKQINNAINILRPKINLILSVFLFI